MTAAELLDRLGALGCRITVTATGAVKALGPVERIDPELRAILHDSREALAVEALIREADRLREFLDGPAPFAARLGRVLEFNTILDNLSGATERLYTAWRARGWAVAWDSKREVFTLTGSGVPPVGSEHYGVQTFKEVS